MYVVVTNVTPRRTASPVRARRNLRATHPAEGDLEHVLLSESRQRDGSHRGSPATTASVPEQAMQGL